MRKMLQSTMNLKPYKNKGEIKKNERNKENMKNKRKSYSGQGRTVRRSWPEVSVGPGRRMGPREASNEEK